MCGFCSRRFSADSTAKTDHEKYELTSILLCPPVIGLPISWQSNRAILSTIESNRFVTGVTWVDGELWHCTWEGDQSDLRRVDPRTGEVLETLEMPPGVAVSGLESDGGELFCRGSSGR